MGADVCVVTVHEFEAGGRHLTRRHLRKCPLIRPLRGHLPPRGKAALLIYRIQQLVLRRNDVFEGVEGLQMLFADRGEDTVVRMHEVRDLLDIMHMTRTHFADKDFM